MSIENNLERIATALEAIATHVNTFRTTTTDEIVQAVLETPVTPKPKKAPKAEVPAAPIKLEPGESVPFAGGVLTSPAGAPPAAPVAVVTPPPAPAPVVAPPPVAAPVAAVPQMTAEQLNSALVAEVGRIGAQEPIAQVIRDLGYSGIRDMPPSLYQELLNRVKAL